MIQEDSMELLPVMTLAARVGKDAKEAWYEEMSDIQDESECESPPSCLEVYFGWLLHFIDHLCDTSFRK